MEENICLKLTVPTAKPVVDFHHLATAHAGRINCGDIIESTSTHDIKSCSCGSVTVDGGKDYIRRGFKKIEDLEDLSICVYYLSDPQDKRLLEIEKNPRKPYKTKKLRDFL